VETSFLALKDIGVKGATADNLYGIMCEVLGEWNLKIENMMCITTDGARNMRGDIHGLN
jgi:hypothetical protein